MLETNIELELGREGLLACEFNTSKNRDKRANAIRRFKRLHPEIVAGSVWGDAKPSNWADAVETCLNELAKKVNTKRKREIRRTVCAEERNERKTPRRSRGFTKEALNKLILVCIEALKALNKELPETLVQSMFHRIKVAIAADCWQTRCEGRASCALQSRLVVTLIGLVVVG